MEDPEVGVQPDAADQSRSRIVAGQLQTATASFAHARYSSFDDYNAPVKIRRRSAFHHIVVEDSGGTRTLHFGDTIQSTAKVDDPLSGALEYVDFLQIATLLRDVRRVLFVGLGAGSGPRQLLHFHPQIEIDVAEIDAEVIRVAEEHFGFAASERCRIHEGDGLSFIENSNEQWDMIILDAYTTQRGDLVVPPELTTTAFFDLCSRRLTPRGLLVFNCADDARSRLAREIHAAIGVIFRCRLTFESSTAENTVVIGSAAPLEQRSTKIIELLRKSNLPDSLVRRCRQIDQTLSSN
jgi:spermidine synthase